MTKTGWSIPATERSNRIREELGLKPLKKPDTGEINEILLEAGLGDIVDIQ